MNEFDTENNYNIIGQNPIIENIKVLSEQFTTLLEQINYDIVDLKSKVDSLESYVYKDHYDDYDYSGLNPEDIKPF